MSGIDPEEHSLKALLTNARSRVIVIAGALVAASIGVAIGAGAVGARLADQSGDRVATAQEALKSEIDAMLDAGMPARDQKVRMLQEEVDALKALEDTSPVPEKGVDLEEVAGGGQRQVELDAPDPAEQWEDGPVECEPIPQRLSVEDIAGASCYVEPQPGGGARYVAVTPDGTMHEVAFEP